MNFQVIAFSAAVALSCAPAKPRGVPVSPSVPSKARNIVPAQAPDSVPVWFRDDSSFVSVSGRGRFLRGAISVLFVEGATQRQRQEAVDRIGGRVIGGAPLIDGNGFYYVRVQDDGTGAQLQHAVELLGGLPQVDVADLIAPGGTAIGVNASSSRCMPFSVPAVPPDSTPGWFRDDSSWTRSSFRYLKHIIGVSFQPGTTQAQRREAIAKVCGTVVGGWRTVPPDRGIYAIQVHDRDDSETIWKLIERLKTLPQVRAASVNPLVTVGPQ